MVEIKGRLIASIKAVPIGDDQSRGPFEGDLSTYGNLDLGGDICEAGCFDRSVSEQGTHRPLLWQHDERDPIGSFDVVTTEGTLRVRGSFNLDTEHGRAGHSLLKHGDIDGLSIGYTARDFYYDKDGVRHLTDLDLMEGSLVTFPMNPLARAEAKSRRPRMSRYAKCAFLAKMSDEERDQALAELDELDRAAEETPEQASKEDEPEQSETTDETPAPEDEKEDAQASEEERTAEDMLRDITKACSDYLKNLEG